MSNGSVGSTSGVRRSGLLLAVAVAGGVWALSLLGILDPLAGLVNDPLLRWLSRNEPGTSPVLLVEINPSGKPAGEAELTKLLDAAETLGARRVVFNFLPPQASAAFYQKAVAYGNVLFGRGTVPDPDDPDRAAPAPLPPGTEGLKLQLGIVATPPAAQGISRRQPATYRFRTVTVPSLEVAAAESNLAGPAPVDGPDFGVNFRGGAGSLPNLPFEQALAGGLVRELVKDRTLLIGFGTPPAMPALHTPTTDDAHPMSLLEFQGQALDTLLSRRPLRPLPAAATLAILLALAGASLLACHWLDVRWASWVTAGLLIVYVTATALALRSSHRWLPLTEAALVQVGVFLAVLRSRAIHAQQAFARLLMDLTTKLRERFWPASFYASQEHWSQVITMVDQTLDLGRVIFLERVVKDHRVREIKALNCSINDIGEMRRDYERTPYSTAIEAKGPIRLEKKYLKAVEGPEDQYLVPLIFAGEVLGFWAFGVDPARAAAIPNFEGVVRDYGGQISELLYHRQRVLKEQAGRTRLRRVLTSERQAELHEALGKTMGLMERRLARTEGLLDEMHTATLVYDLFGRTVKVNARMQDLLKTLGFPPYERTALDLVARLTGGDVATCRRYLRHALIDRGTMSLPVTLEGDRNSYILNLRPLLSREGEGGTDDQAPFHVQGIVCELVDRTSLTRLVEKMGELTQRLGVQLRNQLSAVELAASLLSSAQLPEDKRASVGAGLHAKIKEAVDMLAQCQQYLSMDAPVGEVECFPVDAHVPFQAAREKVRALAEERAITLEVRQPSLMSHVFASPVNLQQVFVHILSLLTRDAVDRGKVQVGVDESEKWVTYAFTNTGFGMPGDRFRGSLTDEAEPVSDDLKNLRLAMRWVKAWKGTLEADSEVGAGIRITLRLERFI